MAARDPHSAALDRLAGLAAHVLGAASAQVVLLGAEETVVAAAGATTTPGGSHLGVPLELRGEVVGALRVADPGPRDWSETEVRLLEQLAGAVVAELELSALTSEHEDERLLWGLAVESAGIGAFDWDLRTGALRWDERLVELFGLTRETFGGTIEAFNALVHPDDRARVSAALSAAIATCGTYEAEYRIVLPRGGLRWIAARGHALAGPDGTAERVLGAAYDTTAEQEAAALARERAELLGRVTDVLTGTLDVDEAVAELAQLVTGPLADWTLVSLVDQPIGAGHGPLGGPHLRRHPGPPAGSPTGHLDPGWRRGLRDVASWHVDPEARDLTERYRKVRIAALSDDSFVAQALTADRPVVVPDLATTAVSAVLSPGPARDLLVELAPRSAVVLPLRGRGRTVGLLSTFRGSERPPFSPADVETLHEAAGRAGLALDNARLYASQRDLAEAFQRSLMTEPPEPDHLHVVVRYEPAAEAAQVGGDWYDAFLQPDGATVVVIGDVVGHDTAAAAAMGQVRGLLRGIAVTTNDGPADVLMRVDRAMRTLQVHTTATAIVARIEQTPEEHEQGLTRLRWSNAGHPPPLVVPHPQDPDGGGSEPVAESGTVVRALWPERPDTLLGIDADLVRGESVLTVPRGSTVLLYTDGLVERRGLALDDGIAALQLVLTELVDAGLPLEELCDRLLERMLPDKPEDDVALVVVRLHPEDRPRPPEAGPTRVPPDVPGPPA